VTRIKICGIIEPRHAITASRSGANFIGVVFAAGKRQVSREEARMISKAVHNLGNGTAVIGVFVNMTATQVNHTADYCGLDWVQLSGDETWDYCQQIKRPIIKALHVSSSKTTGQLLDEIAAGYAFLPQDKLIYLLDTKAGEDYGGTGQSFDWQIAQKVSARYPVIVAGGLTPANVGSLVKRVKPWGVDVSSGVEENSRKSETKIKNFIEAVKEAEGGY
jgi:phosphoribosylanthranilate isomerase